MAGTAAHFRFQAPGSVNNTNNWLALEDTDLSGINDDQVILLRYLVQADGSGVDFTKFCQLEYDIVGDANPAVVITNASSHVVAVSNAADSRTGTTVSMLTPGTGSYSTIDSVNTTGNNTIMANQTLPANEYVEMVTSFKLVPDDFSGTGSLDFTLTNVGTHSVTARIDYVFPLKRRIIII